jgi:enoyl-CoA hydratase
VGFDLVEASRAAANAQGVTNAASAAEAGNGADAITAHFADVTVASERWPDLRAALTGLTARATAAHVRDAIAQFAEASSPGPIAAERARIDRLFAFDTMEEIVAALEADGSAFAQDALKTLRRKSPTSLKVTLKLLRQARGIASLEEGLTHEYRASLEVIVSHEFREGVRAAVIDKDRNPQWQPARLEDVDDAIVARYFARRGADELKF